MTLRECLRAIRAQWLVVLLACVLGLGAAAGLVYLTTDEYTATTRLYVSAKVDGVAVGEDAAADLVGSRTELYTGLLGSTKVTEPVVAGLAPELSAVELLARVTVAPPAEGSPFFDVSVTDESPERSAALADAVGQAFIKVAAEAEPPAEAGEPTVVVSVLQPASVPQAPSGTPRAVTLALGLLSGLAVGLTVALTRGALDPTLRTVEQLREATGDVPVLGTIAADRAIARGVVALHDDPRGPMAEDFRRLRTNVQSVLAAHSATSLVVTSPTPESGKSTTVLNLAVALAATGERVLVVDGDLRRPVLAGMLGLDGRVGITSVLAGAVSTAAALQSWHGMFDVLASGSRPANPSELLGSRGMRDLLDGLREQYDVVLVDSPPLLPVADAAALAQASDGVMLLARYRKTDRKQLAEALDELRVVSAPVLGTVLTMAPCSGKKAYTRYQGGAAEGIVVPAPRELAGAGPERLAGTGSGQLTTGSGRFAGPGSERAADASSGQPRSGRPRSDQPRSDQPWPSRRARSGEPSRPQPAPSDAAGRSGPSSLSGPVPLPGPGRPRPGSDRGPGRGAAPDLTPATTALPAVGGPPAGGFAEPRNRELGGREPSGSGPWAKQEPTGSHRAAEPGSGAWRSRPAPPDRPARVGLPVAQDPPVPQNPPITRPPRVGPSPGPRPSPVARPAQSAQSPADPRAWQSAHSPPAVPPGPVAGQPAVPPPWQPAYPSPAPAARPSPAPRPSPSAQPGQAGQPPVVSRPRQEERGQGGRRRRAENPGPEAEAAQGRRSEGLPFWSGESILRNLDLPVGDPEPGGRPRHAAPPAGESSGQGRHGGRHHHDGPAQHDAAQRGPVQNGPVRNGAAQNGGARNGAAHNGAAHNGAAGNGAAQSHAAQNGPVQDSAVRNRAAQNGAAQNGAPQNRATQDAAGDPSDPGAPIPAPRHASGFALPRKGPNGR